MVSRAQLKQSEGGSAQVWGIMVLMAIIAVMLGLVLWQQLTNSDGEDDPSRNNVTSSDNTSGSEENKQADSSAHFSAYVKSFTLPQDWRLVQQNELCSVFNFCASPPEFAVANSSDKLVLTFSAPQGAADKTMDAEAARSAGDTGVVVRSFTELDALEARKIEFPDGRVVVTVTFQKGFGSIEFKDTADSKDIDTVLSTWTWQ